MTVLRDKGSSELAHLGFFCSTRGPSRPKQLGVHSVVQILPLTIQHMGQEHGGKLLLPDSVGQLHCLDRAASIACGTIRSRRCRRCTLCGVGGTFQDRRQLGHSAWRCGRSQSSRPVPPGAPLDDSPLPNCSIRDIALTELDKQLLTDLRLAPAMGLPRCVVSRHATAWAESLKGAMSGHQSWAVLCRYRCRLLLAEIPKGVGRNSELKQPLQLWETGQIRSAEFWTAAQNSKEDADTARRTARETSLRLDSPRIHQQSYEGTGGRRRAGRTTALIPRSTGTGTHSTGAKCAEAARAAWGGGRYKAARSVRRAKTPQVSVKNIWTQSSPSQVPGRGGACFGGPDIITFKWATGDLPEECRFLFIFETVR